MVDKPFGQMRKDEIILLLQDHIKQLQDAEQKFGSIAALYQELFGGKNENDEVVPGMKQKLDDFYRTNKKTIGDNQAEIEKNLTETAENNQETKKILKGAITVTLAANFQSAKEAQNKRGQRFTISFFVVLVGLVFLNWWLMKNPILLGTESFWESLLPRTTLSFPFVWFAWHCQTTAAEAYRVGEEYHHKQRVMELYVALTSEHSGFRGQEKMGELEKIVSAAIQKNPSKQLKDPSMPGLLGKAIKNNDD